MKKRVEQLLELYLSGTMDEPSKAELAQLLELADEQQLFERTFDKQLQDRRFELEGEYPKLYDRLMNKLLQDIRKVPAKKQRPIHRIHFLKTTWFKYAAAILIITGIGAYLFNLNTRRPHTNDRLAASEVKAPASVLTTLTLSNGKTISLDTLQQGTVATEGNVVIEKLADGRIIYRGLQNKLMLYNTISVPRGSKISSVTLSDGTVVFLNTASTIRYPVVFNGKERKVSVEGEAYFDVAKDASKPFIVNTKKINITVLGTAFNINAYEDEPVQSATLVNGLVKVSNPSNEIIIQPGQQAYVKVNSTEILSATPNLDEVLAWKDGKFLFDDADIKTIMRQIERWYDVDVEYKGPVPEAEFSGSLLRSQSPAGLLRAFELTDEIHFIIEGKKITVIAGRRPGQ